MGGGAGALEADVDLIGDGLLVVVLHDEILVEEAKGLLRGRGGEADEEGVEIFEELKPEGVDGAVGFVDDEEVESLDGDAGIVDDGKRVLVETGQGSERGFVKIGIEVRFASKHGVEALDGGDGDLGDGVELVGLEELNVVELGEFAIFFGCDEFLKFVAGLYAESAAVHEEENSLSASMLDEAITEITSGEGLAAAGGHLNESARAGCGEGLLQAFDGAGLSRPQIALVERRKMLEAGARGRSRALGFLHDPFGERFVRVGRNNRAGPLGGAP